MSRKGYVLTLDITIALMIVLGVLFLSAIIINNAQTGTFLEMQQVRLANDIITVLDERGTLQSLNSSLINSTIQEILPSTFDISMTIKTYDYDIGSQNFIYKNRTKVSGVTNETDRFIGQGKRTFVKFSGTGVANYSVLEYNVWVK